MGTDDAVDESRAEESAEDQLARTAKRRVSHERREAAKPEFGRVERVGRNGAHRGDESRIVDGGG
jgi:hypothetical protein